MEFEEKINIHYTYFGKIGVEYERMCQFLRFSIIFFLNENGLKNQGYSKIMLADLSAYQLISKYRAIYSIAHEKKPEYIKHLDPFFKAMLKINDERNFLIHGEWSIPENNKHNYNSDSEVKSVIVKKNKITKDGIRLYGRKYEKNDYVELLEKIKLSWKTLHLIYSCYLFNEDLFEVVKKENIDKLK